MSYSYKFLFPRYVGNMHGDETVGRQLILYLAEYLLQQYGQNSRIRQLVDNTEIYLMPTMNPDGFANAKEGAGCGGFLGSYNHIFIIIFTQYFLLNVLEN